MVATPIKHVIQSLVSLAQHPKSAHHSDGRLLVGAFAAEKWPTERWRELLDGLAKAGHTAYFMPHFLEITKSPLYLPMVDAACVWGGNHMNQFPTIRNFSRLLRTLGKGWVAPIWPQDFRPKSFWFAEAENSRLYRAGWAEAMETRAEAVIISTWNDYSEHSEIRPSTGIQYAFYDLTAFFIEWFKIGAPPAIQRDVLYYFHRIETTQSGRTGSAQPKRYSNRFSEPEVNQIELLAFLTKPGRLEIETAKQTVSVIADAGISSVRAPLASGRPRFRLFRDTFPKISFESAFQIRDTSLYQDLLYRGGSSSRPPVE
jgi:hypothetical protein